MIARHLPLPETDRYADPEDWRIVRALGIYRVFLMALLGGIHLGGYSRMLFDRVEMHRFEQVLLLYMLCSALLAAAALLRRPRLLVQAHAALITDLLFTVALLYAAGGIGSGIGALLITPVATGALVLSLRFALLHAALATLVLFGEELWRQTKTVFVPSELTETGVLGLALFATAVAGGVVARRARRSEALAERAGTDLAHLTRLNERVVESISTGTLVIDEQQRLRHVNAAARRLLGGAGVENAPLALSFPALAALLSAWQQGASSAPPPFEAQPGGTELIAHFIRLGAGTGAPVLIQLEDAARMREAAQQLKLAALGRLSAGIAHEIRNPLSAIHHASQLLGESPHLDDADRKLLEMVRRHSLRIDRIVEDVLDLSRRDTAVPGTISLREFLENSITVYREGCPQREVRIDFDRVPHDLDVRFDPNQLQQILHNLWDNTFNHGTRADGGVVSIRLEGGRLFPGQKPYLDIADDGRGIPRELEDRIFEPFFTAGRSGTGLGLYLARELCDYNQARLSYVPGEHGACFRIVFAPA